jgi:MFS family permease
MSSTRSQAKSIQIAAAVIGNALEWYDFIVFGFFTAIISRLFFPSQSQYASLLLATATFGVGFFMRPVGGILLGIFADRKGRKAALLLIIALMTAAIALIAFAPTYAAIGVAAPLIIVVARLLQGLATGGEFASATVFLIESAPAGRQGLYGSWQMVGQCLAALLGALIGALITRALPPAALDSWGWRVPFLFGLAIGPVGLLIRRYVRETEPFLESRRGGAGEPLKIGTLLASRYREVLASMGLVVAGTIQFYVVLLYMPTFAGTELHLPLDQAFLAQAIGLACAIFVTPFSGALSDHVGRKPVLITSLALYLALTYPFFSWVHEDPSFRNLLIMQVTLCTVLGLGMGPFSTALAEQFPARVRSTGVAVAYNIAVMLFGGFAQFFVTWLIKATGSPIAPAFYVMFGAACGLVAVLFLKDGVYEVDLPPAARLNAAPN